MAYHDSPAALRASASVRYTPHQIALRFRIRVAHHMLCGTATPPARPVTSSFATVRSPMPALLRLVVETPQRALHSLPPVPDRVVATPCLAFQLRDQRVELDLWIDERQERFEVAAIDRRIGVLHQLHVCCDIAAGPAPQPPVAIPVSLQPPAGWSKAR